MRSDPCTETVYEFDATISEAVPWLGRHRAPLELQGAYRSFIGRHADLFGGMDMPRLRFHNKGVVVGDENMSYYDPQEFVIVLVPTQRNMCTLLHEMAHVGTPGLHGALFQRRYMRILGEIITSPVLRSIILDAAFYCNMVGLEGLWHD